MNAPADLSAEMRAQRQREVVQALMAVLPMSTIEPALKEAEKRELISRDFATIAPTPLGQRFLNDLQELFLHDD